MLGPPAPRSSAFSMRFDALARGSAQELGGAVRFSLGDSYCVTFAEATQAIAWAERLTRSWDAIRHRERFDCTISVGLHRGTLYTFRSFLYGRDVWIAPQLQSASAKLLESEENGIFVTARLVAIVPNLHCTGDRPLFRQEPRVTGAARRAAAGYAMECRTARCGPRESCYCLLQRVDGSTADFCNIIRTKRTSVTGLNLWVHALK
jgi:class 3 adenylate cyclase